MASRRIRSKVIFFATAAFATLLTGCLATPYQPDGLGGGYSESRIDASTMVVSFRANSQTPRRLLESYLLYRCAQVTRAAGFDYFVPLDPEGKPSALGKWIPSLNPVNEASGAQSSYFPPNAISVTAEGAARVSIRMFNHAKAASNPGVYRTDDVLDALAPVASGETEAAAGPVTGRPRRKTQIYSGPVIDYLAGE